MQQTSNYQLNQWEGTDRILRTDFNADNAKIDAAIAELRKDLAAQIEAVRAESRLVLLKRETLDTDVSEVEISLEAEHPEQYFELLIYVEPSASTTASSLSLHLNDLTSYWTSGAEQTELSTIQLDSVDPSAGFARFTLLLSKYIAGKSEYTRCTTLQHFYTSLDGRIAELAAEDLKTLRIFCEDDLKIGKGTRFTVLGIRR